MVFMLAKAIKTTKALDGDSPESAMAHATGNRQRATSNLQLATGNRRCCCCLPANKVGFYSIVRLISSWKKMAKGKEEQGKGFESLVSKWVGPQFRARCRLRVASFNYLLDQFGGYELQGS